MSGVVLNGGDLGLRDLRRMTRGIVSPRASPRGESCVHEGHGVAGTDVGGLEMEEDNESELVNEGDSAVVVMLLADKEGEVCKVAHAGHVSTAVADGLIVAPVSSRSRP